MRKDKMVRLTEEEIRLHIAEGLATLNDHCERYDEGRVYVAFSMATEVQRSVAGKGIVAKYRGLRTFKTRDLNLLKENNLLASNKLIFASIGSRPPYLEYLPAYRSDDFATIRLKFRDWWNRDVIYQASAALPGTPPDMIPVREQDQVPIPQRMKLVRREFVEMMRNKFGAHLDEEIPEVLSELQKTNSYGVVFGIKCSDGVSRSTLDGTLPVKVGPAAAMMRQIAQEVLEAYNIA